MLETKGETSKGPGSAGGDCVEGSWELTQLARKAPVAPLVPMAQLTPLSLARCRE